MSDKSRDEASSELQRISKRGLDRLIHLLWDQGYTVVGPRVEESAIVYDEITALDNLPQGYRDQQAAGQYRISSAAHTNYFEFNVGPHSWKQFLFPPQLTVSTSTRRPDGWEFETPQTPQPKYAFLGVRACELAAIAVQDRVFLEGPYVDPVYKARRESFLIIAVNCTVAASTCFCTSMGSGPTCKQLFDLAITELDEGFVVEAATERGAELLAKCQPTAASEADITEASRLQQRAVDQITKHFNTDEIRDLLLSNLDHHHWDDVAERCLSCTNCTMVCPTCFCSSVKEVSDLEGEQIERQREWDSCFNLEFSYTAGGVVRNNRRSRFRQWLTHKLASWHDQFDSSGCVGCGRCITWCPVGIDLTEEVTAIRNAPSTRRQLPIAEPAKTTCALPQEGTP